MQIEEHGRTLWVVSSFGEIHEMISMNKPLDFLLK